MAVADNRPVIIAESAPARYNLANPVEAEAAWNEWFVPYFQLIALRPEIKWFHLVSYDWTKSSYYLASGWKNNDFTASSVIMQRLVQELAKPAYLHATEKSLLKDFGAHQ